jgi:hypothetical protein
MQGILSSEHYLFDFIFLETMLVCEFDEVMWVLKVYDVFPLLGRVGVASANTFAVGLSNQKVICIRREVSACCFSGFGKTILMILVGCLTFLVSGCGAGVTVSIGGGLAVSPGTINFGSVLVGHEAQSSVTVSNRGSAAVSVSEVSVSGQMFSVSGTGPGPITIPAGGAYPVKVGFTPVSAGSYSGQLTVVDASSQPIAQVSMQGQGSPQGTPQLTVSAASLSFGSVAINTATTQSITLTSTGTLPVTIDSAAITGTRFTMVGGGLPVTLNPGQSTVLQVRFFPKAVGPASGQITISSNASSKSTTLVTLVGTGTPSVSPLASPQLTVSAASLSFGNITIGAATTQSLTLTSTGTAPVTVDSTTISGAGFAIIGGSLPVTLNPTQSMSLLVQFKPATTGAANGHISISSNSSSGSTSSVALSGTATAAPSPQLTLSTASLSFGSVTLDTVTTQPLTLTSTGTAPVTINSAVITGAGEFTVVGGNLPATLNPMQSMTLQVKFKPTATGATGGQITIDSNSSNGGTSVVVLSGTGIAAPSPQLTLSVARLNFGDVMVDAATTQSLTLTSTGTSPVMVNSAAISGAGFSILDGHWPTTLNPTESMTVRVQFDPTTTGSANGYITIHSNSSSGSISSVALRGTATAAPSPQLTLSTASLSFGSVTVDTATTQSLTLTSTGTSPVTINSAAITGPGFSILDGHWPTTLNPTESMTVRVQFDPATTGVANGQIAISSNSSTESTAIVTTSGTSTAAASPQLAVSAGSLSFGSVTVNTATTQPLTLTSTGTAPVTVNSAAISGTGFAIVGGSFPITLDPSQSITLHVQFLPEATGAASGQITISSNSSSGSTTGVALSGTSTAAASPQLAVSAGSLNFGSVTVDTATTQSLTLTSTGTAPVAVNAPAIVGAGFTTVGGGEAITLNPGQSTTLQVQFDPATSGAASGQITISSNSSTGGTTVITLNGTSIAAASPELKVSSGSLSFGDVIVDTSTTQSLALTSVGTAPVTINSARITGPGFAIVGGNLPVTLSPTQSVPLQVQFDPTQTGAANGQITISSNSSSGATTMVTLSGTSTAAASPQLTVSATSLNFGNVTAGTATTQSLTLSSNGTAPVTVNSAAITGIGFTIVGGTLPVTLSPTQSVTLQVRFGPTAIGAASGQIAISSNSSAGSTTVVMLNGTSTAATSPQLTVSAASLSFGNVTVGTATTQSLTLSSTGTAPVTVNSTLVSGSGFTIVGANLPVTLSPTQSVTLQVQFDPTAIGAASGRVTISSNSSNGTTTTVTLSGTSTAATSPQLTVSAASLSFGSVTVGTAATQSLTLSSTGTAPVTVNSAAIIGTGFTIVGGNLPVTLSPTQSMTLQLQFDPTATGAEIGQVTISSNSSTGSTVAVALSGAGIAAIVSQLTVSTASLSFGNMTVGTATTLPLTLTSTGTSPVTVNSATISGSGFTIVAQSFPVTLSPRQSVTLQVQFEPTTTGAAGGQITISSNSATGGTQSVILSGTGNAANPNLTISNASVSFGSIAINTATTKSLTLTSTGTTPVTVNSAAITGAGFTIVGGSFPVTLNPTQTLTLQLQFEPTTAAALSGQMTISSNSISGSTAIVALTGTGVAVAHSVDLSWDAPTSSPDPVVGYNIYRSTADGAFVLLNSLPDSAIVYVDNSVVSGDSYSYTVKSVDSAGVESVASNQITATIP